MANMEIYMSEIDRAFRVLGAERGFDQNVTDIKAWRDANIITQDEYKTLRQYNREAYSDLPLDW